MTDYQGRESFIIEQAFDATSTTKKHDLGTIVRANDSATSSSYGAGEFIYLEGLAATVVGSWVHYDMDDGGTTLVDAGTIGPVAVAMSINTASQFGWYQIGGKAIGKCLTGFADNAQVWLTSTAGSIDDTSAAGDLVSGAKGASTTVVDSTVADFEIARPFTTSGNSGS